MTSLLKPWENFDLHKTRQIMYNLKGNDASFPANAAFHELDFLNQKLWSFKWNLAYFSPFCHDLSLIILKSRDNGYQF